MSTTWFGFYYILGIFHVEDIRRFQGKLISLFQFIIELEDDVRLLSCAFVHLDSCLVGCIWSCQQLFARIPGQSENPVVFILPFPALCAQFG